MTPAEWILGALVFGCVAALVLGVARWIRAVAARRVQMRLAALRSIDDGLASARAIREGYQSRFNQLPGLAWLGRLCAQAGRPEAADRVALLCAGLGAGAAAIGWLLSGSLGMALAASVLAPALVIVRLLFERRERLQRFDEQLPDALGLMARSLRAGNPLLDSINFLAAETPEPLSGEFRQVWSEVNYGVTLNVALRDLAARVPSVSLGALITAILVQRETGGNLAEILDRLGATLRARARFARRVRTLTAEGRASAAILVVIPFLLAGALSVSSPTYLPLLLDDPAGRKLLMTAGALMSAGIWWISRIVRLTV